MISEKAVIWEPGEYEYRLAAGFVPNIVTYIHQEDSEKRPAVLVVPGGAYCNVSPTEGGIVAEKFYEAGYQAFVLTYTTNLLLAEPLFMQPLRDISRAVRYIRANAAAFHVNNTVNVCGFSAGGHLCASLCVHHRDIEDEKYGNYSNRPDAAVLSYAPVTSKLPEHEQLFKAILGVNLSTFDENEPVTRIPGCKTMKEAIRYQSVEEFVTPDTPPCFLWQTATDELVPVENIYIMAKALGEHAVPFACHVFSHGPHGLSLADARWASGDFGEEYTTAQARAIIRQVETGELELTEEEQEGIRIFKQYFETDRKPDFVKENKEAAQWFDMAVNWMKALKGEKA